MELARNDFMAVLKIDPTNKAAKDQVTIIIHKIKQELEKEKKKYGTCFFVCFLSVFMESVAIIQSCRHGISG